VGVGLLLPYVMEFNMPERVPELGRIARALGAGGGAAPLAGEALARAGIEAVAGLLAAVGIPTTLRDLGLAADQLDETAQLSMKSTRLVDNNPRTLDADAARRILQAAYDGDRTGLGCAVEVAAAPH
jgi:alcohol dehydrogenase class IV